MRRTRGVTFNENMPCKTKKRSISIQYSIFLTTCDVDRIVKAREEMLLILYGGISNENLDILRYHRFASKVAVGNVCVQVYTLPPTSGAAKFHSMRVFLQCQCWIGAGDGLNPNDLGWYTLDNKLLPLKSKRPAAPEELLKMIRCNCKSTCEPKRCTCRKYGLDCTVACTDCVSCSNSPGLTFADINEI